MQTGSIGASFAMLCWLCWRKCMLSKGLFDWRDRRACHSPLPIFVVLAEVTPLHRPDLSSTSARLQVSPCCPGSPLLRPSSGFLAYGLMNQLYYAAAFVSIWLGPLGAVQVSAEIAAARGMGSKLALSTRHFGKVCVDTSPCYLLQHDAN